MTQDEGEAVKWVRMAAEQDYAEAQYDLGARYEDGRGMPEDDAEAIRWYRKAAEQGYREAQDRLGIMFRDGRGVPQDEVQAYAWLNLAGSGEKDQLREHMTAEQIAQAQKLSISLYLRQYTRPRQGTFVVQPRLSAGFLRELSN